MKLLEIIYDYLLKTEEYDMRLVISRWSVTIVRSFRGISTPGDAFVTALRASNGLA